MVCLLCSCHMTRANMSLFAGTGGSPEEEGGELLTAVLGRLLEQYEALLVRLQERHGFQLEQLLNARLNFQQSRRHRREVR